MRHSYVMEKAIQPLFNRKILLVTFGLGILFTALSQCFRPPDPEIDTLLPRWAIMLAQASAVSLSLLFLVRVRQVVDRLVKGPRLGAFALLAMMSVSSLLMDVGRATRDFGPFEAPAMSPAQLEAFTR